MYFTAVLFPADLPYELWQDKHCNVLFFNCILASSFYYVLQQSHKIHNSTLYTTLQSYVSSNLQHYVLGTTKSTRVSSINNVVYLPIISVVHQANQAIRELLWLARVNCDQPVTELLESLIRQALVLVEVHLLSISLQSILFHHTGPVFQYFLITCLVPRIRPYGTLSRTWFPSHWSIFIRDVYIVLLEWVWNIV